jgi:hypothetical protein
MRVQLDDAPRGAIPPMRTGRTVTTRDISRTLNVTLLTVLEWRRGTNQRRPLPVNYSTLGKSRRIEFVEADLRAYLAEYRPDLLDIWRSQTD